MELAPLPVVVPLLAAAVLAGGASLFSRRALDVASCLAAAFNVAVCGALVRRAAETPIVYWFGGWLPATGFPGGVCFVIDPIAAGLAAFASLLVLSSFVVSWGYFETVKSFYHAIMLVFLAAMCGLCLAGDLFNLFVWFELMTAAGVALSGYKVYEKGPLQGALNFAVMNTLGAYLSLTGIALLYAMTGALNLAQIGATLAAQDSHSGFLPIAFLFVSAGFLVKAAAFPFHFWLDDAHAAAPTPVCVLFSGIMVQLGLYVVARIYWSVFAIPLAGRQEAVQAIFLTMGALTALIAAVACFGQRHLKRLLAFSTISHMGLMLLGFAVLTPQGLAGCGLYLLGHGLVKSTLFICGGILLNRFRTVDEYRLRGAGRDMPLTGMLMALAAIALAGAPPFANFFGEAFIHEAAKERGLGWISWIFATAGAVTSAAVLRAAARIFLGWGAMPSAAESGSHDVQLDRETSGPISRVLLAMWLPASLLLVAAAAISPANRLDRYLAGQAHAFVDSRAYQTLVLQGKPPPAPAGQAAEVSAYAFAKEAGVLAAAAAGAFLALFPSAFGRPFARFSGRIVLRVLRPIRAIHSGKVGDYVAWFVFGVTAYGLLLLFR